MDEATRHTLVTARDLADTAARLIEVADNCEPDGNVSEDVSVQLQETAHKLLCKADALVETTNT